MLDRHPSPIAFIENLLKPMRLYRKVKLVVTNNATKVKTFHNCCGNLGQPGC
jgi:hypothetical protein